MTTTRALKPERLAARVSAKQKALIERAAAIEGRTLTDFVISRAEEAARETIRNHEVLQLSIEGARQFFDAIENPPEPNEHMIAAVVRYEKLVSY